MGGSKSRGYRPSAPSSPCARLTFQAAVNSPQPAVIAKLTVGAVLDVVAGATGQTVVVEFVGQVAGVLTGIHVSQLANCIASGFQFQAVVVQLQGGLCVVKVSPT
jgi:hypothetical protein